MQRCKLPSGPTQWIGKPPSAHQEQDPGDRSTRERDGDERHQGLVDGDQHVGPLDPGAAPQVAVGDAVQAVVEPEPGPGAGVRSPPEQPLLVLGVAREGELRDIPGPIIDEERDDTAATNGFDDEMTTETPRGDSDAFADVELGDTNGDES